MVERGEMITMTRAASSTIVTRAIRAKMAARSRVPRDTKGMLEATTKKTHTTTLITTANMVEHKDFRETHNNIRKKRSLLFRNLGLNPNRNRSGTPRSKVSQFYFHRRNLYLRAGR
jgi:hypothetical protein